MKKILIATFLTLVSAAGFAQGGVDFANSTVGVGWIDTTIERHVRWDATAAQFNPGLTAGGLVSSNYNGVAGLTGLRAALYYAASTDNNLADFVAASGGSSTFRGSTAGLAGTWFSHFDTLDTIPNGTTANLVVFVWDTSVNADPRAAGAAGGLYGASSIFQYTPPTTPIPAPSDFVMNGLTGFTVGVIPERSTFALAGMGAAALLIFRRGSYFG